MIGVLHIQNQTYDKALIDNGIVKCMEIIGSQNIGHAFHNDIVEVIDNKITKVIKSDIANKQIAGVLIKNSKYKYGFKKKGVELFLFKPLSHHYPFFLVASSSQEKVNQYAIIQFKEWSPGSKLPLGQIVRIIGNTDDINNTYEAIIYKNNLIPDQYKFKTKVDPNFDPLTYFNDLYLTHKNIVDEYVFSVDPLGCEDIDDALSVRKDKDHYVVSVHIADVSFYFDHFNLETPKKYSTIYAPHKNYSMIPNILATNICSLKPNKNRLAFTVRIKMSLDSQVIDYTFEKTIINSKKAYDYDELQKLIDLDKKLKDETDLYNVGQKLYTGASPYNTHKMVEVYMILANKLVGQYLYEKVNDKKKIIYRVHDKPVTPVTPVTSVNSEKKMLTHNEDIDYILGILESNAAIYTNEHSNYYHNGLGIDYYTHFTSPIRRYVDIYIHKLLNYVISNNNNIIATLVEPSCMAINEFNKNVKKAEREFNKIELAYKLSLNDNTLLDAYIISIENNKVTVYIPEHKLVSQIKLYDKRLAEIVNTNCTEDYVELINKTSNCSITLHKYDLIQVKLAYTMYNDEIHKKIDIYIPAVQELLHYV